MKQFGDDRFDVVTDISSLGQGGAVTEDHGYVQAPGQRLGQ